MKLIIDNNISVPIYKQIKKNIINQILTNELQEEESLPSIRNLAKDIRISVMTIKKAYDELEEEGYIKTVQGKGSFILPRNLNLIKEQKKIEIEDYINKIIEISKCYNIKKDEILDLIEYLYGDEENE